MRQLVCLFFILASSCTTGVRHPHLATPDQLLGVDKISQQIWIEYQTKDSIPFALQTALDDISKQKFEIANSNERFQATDAVGLEDLPWRQLQYLGHCGIAWVMTYKHGGIGLHYHIIICKIVNGTINLLRSGTTATQIETMPQIKQALENQKILFKQIDWYEDIDDI